MDGTGSTLKSLTDISGSITRAFQSTEEKFLAIGDRLGVSIESLNGITGRCDGVLAQLDSDEIRGATQNLSDAAAHISLLAGSLGDKKTTLDRLGRLNGELASRVGHLTATVKAVDVLAINAKIAASHLSTGAADFAVFTGEIGRLSKLAQASLADFGKELAALTDSVRTAGAVQLDFEKRQAEAVRSVPRRLREHLDSVTAHRNTAAAAAATVGEKSRKVSQRIGEAISALQIADITRQRVEHVEYALEALRRLLRHDQHGDSADHIWWHGLDGDHQHALIGLVCRLQAAQLSNAAKDFDQEVRRVIAALQALARDTRDIVGLARKALGASGDEHGTFLTELEREVSHAHALTNGYTTARAEADRVVQSVSKSVEGLGAHVDMVRSIEADIRLMGLNTTFKCGRLGVEGLPLSIIAQELRTYANSTGEDVEIVMARLQEVVATAASLTEAQRQDGADIDPTGLADGMTEAAGRLGTAGQALGEGLTALERDSDRVAGLLDDTKGSITFHDETRAALIGAAEALNKLGGPEPRGADFAALKEKMLSLTTTDYTMASERAIHGKFGQAVPAVTPAAQSTEDLLDDILF
ncbi:MAG TPA: hypothetical protein VM689_18395 [Aliidongia sp.]|nr:hypothetical protein [Aliidongia sp.]